MEARSDADGAARARLLRRDPRLTGLLRRLEDGGLAELAAELLAWALAREAERRSLAGEALERYRELNLLYGLAERVARLDSAAVLATALSHVTRAVSRGSAQVLVTDDAGGRLMPTATSGVLATGIRVGEGIVGGMGSGAEGEIVNHPATDPRASAGEAALGPLMAAPLRVGGRVLGVLLVTGPGGTEFTAGEHRLLTAVASLTAPALDAAIAHERTMDVARAREAELERQLDQLRDEVEARRREAHVREITGSEYFRTLRQQADQLRHSLEADAVPHER